MLRAILVSNPTFTTFGHQHLAGIGLTILATVLLPLIAIRFLSHRGQLCLSRFLSIVLSLAVMEWVFIRICLGVFDKTTDLPLDICNLGPLLLLITMWNPSRRVHEVLYFWVLVGTLQAVLTPNLVNGFPNYVFLKYWLVHSGLIVLVVYFTVVFRVYPDRRSIVKSLLWLHGYGAVIFVVNLILGSNYFYIMRKPPTRSLLDYFGPWPWYILVCEVLLVPLFVLVYLPVALFRRGRKPLGEGMVLA